jgi:hypothetical protein
MSSSIEAIETPPAKEDSAPSFGNEDNTAFFRPQQQWAHHFPLSFRRNLASRCGGIALAEGARREYEPDQNRCDTSSGGDRSGHLGVQ